MNPGFNFPINIDPLSRYVRPITPDDFKTLLAQTHKRKRFCDSQDPIKASAGGEKLFLNFKFKETIEPILFEQFGVTCFPNNFGYGACFDLAQKEQLDAFISRFNRTVFIKSLLPCMVALDMNFESNSENEYTETGKNEHQAKEFGKRESVDFLTESVIAIVQNLPYYNKVAGIACVPPSTGKATSLPQIIAQEVAQSLEITDFSQHMKFLHKNRSLQDEAGNEKWAVLSDSGLEIEGGKDQLLGKQILLIDDLYQSGATIHFTAMHLQQAGASSILGLALVKSRRDDDNRERNG